MITCIHPTMSWASIVKRNTEKPVEPIMAMMDYDEAL